MGIFSCKTNQPLVKPAGVTGTGHIFFAAAGLIYLAAFVLRLTRSRRGRPDSFWPGIEAAGWLAQTAGLWLRGQHNGCCPVANLFETAQFAVWTLVFLYLLAGAAFRLSFPGIFSPALAAFFTLLSLAVPAWDAGGPSAALREHPAVSAHAALAVFSCGVFGLLAVTSLMYLIQHYNLKSRRQGRLALRIPSLVQLERINRRLLLAGFAALTAASALGLACWRQADVRMARLKLSGAALLWLACLAVLVLGRSRRLLPARLAWAGLSLFAAALAVLGPVEMGRGPPEPPASARQH